MSDTLFAYLRGAVSNGDDTDPEDSSSFYGPPWSTVQNVIAYRRETVSLDSGETRAITVSTAWTGFMCRVIGHAKATTTGKNWDGSTDITGVTAGYGVARHPGYISFISEKLVTLTLEGLADGTTVEYLLMTLAQDDEL